MRTTQNGLTRREREYLDHLRQAQGQQLTLAQYCRARGLRAQRLYSVSAKLVRKGYVEHRRRAESASMPAVPGQFVAVRVAAPTPSSAGAGCRLRHPSGWTIECADLPQASWLRALVQGGDHAAT